MRRVEKEITNPVEIEAILKKALICRIALSKENQPYLVPMFYGYKNRCLYFHTAKEGLKIDYMLANERVCFEVEGPVQILPDEKEACRWSASFESVIGFGRVLEIVLHQEKKETLNCLMKHYSGRQWDFDPIAFEQTRVWCVQIESMTGKRSVMEEEGGRVFTESFHPS